MFIDPSTIKGLHLELTSRCPLLCQQCARVHNGKQLGTLPMADIDPQLVDNVLKQLDEIGSKLEEIHVCGNYGDFLSYRFVQEFLDVFQRYRQKNADIVIRLYTNGSGRSAAFWENVATKIGNNGEVVFSIDGLGDTNHLYRKNSSWEKVMTSVQAFIGAGGKAIWEMLVFQHNEHQIEEARALAAKLGFHEFRIKKASRFTPFDDQSKATVKQTTLDAFKDQAGQRMFSKGDVIKTGISCKYQERKWIFLSFEGDLFPCCWLGGGKYKPKQETNPVFKLFEKYGHDFLSVKNKSIFEVLNHEWFKKYLIDSWGNSMDDETNPVLPQCVKQCDSCVSAEHKSRYVVMT